jgi:hypothetical protein
MKIYRNLVAMAAIAAPLTIAAQAHANSISFFLTTPESGSPPANPVEITVTTGSITGSLSGVFTFTAGGSGPFTAAQVLFSNPVSTNMAPVEINVSGAFEAQSSEGLAAASPCVGNGAVVSGVSTCVTGGSGAATFGTMSLETGAASHPTITITLAAEGTNTWADALSVLAPDSKGFEALVANGTGIQDGGFATPLPATLPLFVSGIGGLGLLGWRRKRKAQAGA